MDDITKLLNLLNDLVRLTEELDNLLYRSIGQFLYSTSISQKIMVTVDVEKRLYRTPKLVSNELGLKYICVDVTWQDQVFEFNKIRIVLDPAKRAVLHVHLMHLIEKIEFFTDIGVYNLDDTLRLVCNVTPADIDKAIASTSDEEAKKILERLKALVSMTKAVLNL